MDNTKEILNTSVPIDTVLHCITMISNPCDYKRRYVLAKEFIKRMEKEKNIILYVVEIAYINRSGYSDQEFMVTDANNSKHLQIKMDGIPMWHKENAINIGIKKLLPVSWKAVAWLDSDLYFEDPNWAINALKLLNGYNEVLQLFSIALDMDYLENTLAIHQSFGHQYRTGKKNLGTTGVDYWHPGYAWACTRTFFERMGGLYDKGILGSGDYNMAMSFIGLGHKSVHINASDSYKRSIAEFESKVRGVQFGYVPGTIRHYFHGSKENRKYTERWEILINNKYDPINHIEVNGAGLYIPTKSWPKRLTHDIMIYFYDRKEDNIDNINTTDTVE
jgi:hypothetical protein